jgi:glycosyltransferase involved in cell wall biosynthesis
MIAPLVSCIMPTFNRRRFVPAAIAHFRRQDWPDKELVVIDDGADSVRDLVPDDPRIVYIRLDTRATIGHKRNLACDRARGEIVAHWDDDDWHAPSRLRLQAQALLASTADLCGITRLFFCNPEEGRAWEFVYMGGAPWVGGSSMMYRRAGWAKMPFPDCDVGEDTRFVASRARQQVLVLADGSFHVGRIHRANVTPKIANGPAWRPLPIEKIHEILGADWAEFAYPECTRLPSPPSGPMASCIMPTANRRAFVALALEHFQAQDYAPSELVVVDSGDDTVDDLCRNDARFRYVRAPRGASIGAQRNLACAAARGDIVVHWDDDDWFGRHRLRCQIEPIAAGRADVTGLENRYVWNLIDGSFWTLSEELHQRMFVGNVHGGTLAYRKSLLGARLRYDDINLAEDAGLLTRLLHSGARLERVANDGVFVYVRHGRNAWRFETGSFLGHGWSRIAAPVQMPAEMLQRYRAVGGPGHVPVAALAEPMAPAARSAQAPREGSLIDCLGSTGVTLPAARLRYERCVVLVASESCTDFLEGALASLARFGGIADVARVVFLEEHAPRGEAVATRHGATIARCGSARGAGPWLKGALYSITHAVEAKQYLCLDADVLVLDSLAPLFKMHAALRRGQVLIAPEATRDPVTDLRHGLQSVYLATLADAERLLAPYPGAATNPNVVNDGVFVADFEALTAVDETLRSAPALCDWVVARRDVWWRAKAALNVALARAHAITPLDSAYNAQLHLEPAKSSTIDGQPGATWRGRPAKVLHFNGRGKNSYAAWKRIVLDGG